MLCEVLHFFSAAAEKKRIASFKPDDGFTFARFFNQ
jgi:hypothetical protein